MRATNKALEKVDLLRLDRLALNLDAATIQFAQPLVDFAQPMISPMLVTPAKVWVAEGELTEEVWLDDGESPVFEKWKEPCLFWQQEYRRGQELDENLVPAYKKCPIEFFKLGNVSEKDFAQQVISFASKWGVLGIAPSIHIDATPRRYTLTRWEPLSMWKEAAQRVEGILLAFAHLSIDNPTTQAWTQVRWDAVMQEE